MIFIPFFSRFPYFPDLESRNPDFCVVHVNQLEKSFEMIGHMTFSAFSGFFRFPYFPANPETEIRIFWYR